ncbi:MULTISPECIES: recombinase family protein [Haloarcula]|uniref:recombinase family protein n=1 Tax=Haloarcula TaxID=2237 RepID=UPI0023E8E1B7|nr:recombinase family protein [Halomicroarcula sp. SHR3]
MNVVGYGRVSTDDDGQESSLPNQQGTVKQFCDETDEKEYGGTHDFCGWYEEEVSGSVRPVERDQFSELVEHLNEDKSIDAIVVKNFKRLGRDPIDQITIKRDLELHHVGREIEILQASPWEGDRRSLMDPRTKNILKSNDPRGELNRAMVFIMNGIMAQNDIIQSSEDTREGLKSKKERGEHIGNTPWGITTDKVYYEDETQSKYRLPGEKFHVAIEVLNRQSQLGDPNEKGTADGLWSYADGKGMGSPSSTIKRMWENRDDYRKALENAQRDEFADDFTVDDIELEFFD